MFNLLPLHFSQVGHCGCAQRGGTGPTFRRQSQMSSQYGMRCVRQVPCSELGQTSQTSMRHTSYREASVFISRSRLLESPQERG